MIKNRDNETRLRDKVGIVDNVKISGIRDGAYTAAVGSGADITLAKLLGGHATGMPDYYVRRNPKMVADVCEAIETYYLNLYLPPVVNSL